MTDAGTVRVRPIRDRQVLLKRARELADAAAAIDAEQQRLAAEFARLRRELATLRDQLWPAGAGRAFAKAHRPRVGGPTPVPPPLPDAKPLRGRALRDAALRVMLRADCPLTLAEIHRALHLAGFVVLANDPVKRLGDALGYEERRGVVRRVARGTYAISTLTPHRRRALRRDESSATATASRRSRP